MTRQYRLFITGLTAILLFNFSVFLMPVFGKELPLDGILSNMKATFAHINDYSAILHLKTDIKQIRIPDTEIKVFFKQPDKLRFKSKGFAILPRQGMFFNPNSLNKNDFYMSVLGKDLIGANEFTKVELVPRKDSIKLRKLILWVDTDRWIVMKIETLTWQGQAFDIYFDYNQFLNKFWMPVSIRAVVDLAGFKWFDSFHDHPEWEESPKKEPEQNIGEIKVEFSKYKINEGIPDSVFEKE